MNCTSCKAALSCCRDNPRKARPLAPAPRFARCKSPVAAGCRQRAAAQHPAKRDVHTLPPEGGCRAARSAARRAGAAKGRQSVHEPLRCAEQGAARPAWHKLLPLLLSLTLATTPAHAQKTREETVVFGTYAAITIVGAAEEKAQPAIREIFAKFAEMHDQFYPWREGGELRELNARIAAGELPVQVSAEMARIIAQAQEFSAHSEGLFNPGVGALVQLWGFYEQTGEVREQIPTQAEVKALVESGVDIASVQLRGNEVLAAPRTLLLDFGAMAKGTSLDVARDILHRHGIRNALIDVGGNVMALGKNGDRHWRVALSPARGKPPVATVNLHDGEAVATSGGSQLYFYHQGRRYSHILDPRTGNPTDGQRPASVIATGKHAGAISDATATALVIAEDDLVRRMLPKYGVEMAWRYGGEPTAAMKERLQEGE